MSLDQPKRFVKHQSVTRDAFLGGRIIVSQPASGFRAGLDSVLLGSALGDVEGHVLDLGAGVGTAAFVALAHGPALRADLVEIDAATAEIAQANVSGNGFSSRARVIVADVAGRGAERSQAGLPSDFYQTVIANPPFFDRASGTKASDARRAQARHMGRSDLDLWVKAAATSAAPAGQIIFIHTVEVLAQLLESFDARFGGLTVLPIAPREGEAASRVLIRGIKGSRAPLRLLAPLVLHEAEGRGFRPQVDAIFRGEARLDW